MNVYIRTTDEARGRWFCNWSPDQMDELLESLSRAGGVYCGAWEYQNTLSYQFIHDEGYSGAEIVVHLEDI